MRKTEPALDASLVVVAMARDLEMRLAALLAGERRVSTEALRAPLDEMVAALDAQTGRRDAARAIALGAMAARLRQAVSDLDGAGRHGELTLEQRGAAWRLGAELTRVARELPQLLQADA